MSILIKGMKMPKSCEECALWDIDHSYCRVPDVPWTDYFYGDARLDDCPLVEVPTPHGRLIDASDLSFSMTDSIDQGIAEEVVADAPTIIEAEEGAEE